jgi:mono/diheme cytochrome c family protein
MMAVTVSVLLLGACGGGGGGNADDAGGAPRPTGAAADDTELLEGRDVWVSSCARCHGSGGDGRIGPPLSGGRVVERFPQLADQVELVRNGRFMMPAWEGRLSREQIAAVVRYTREVL